LVSWIFITARNAKPQLGVPGGEQAHGRWRNSGRLTARRETGRFAARPAGGGIFRTSQHN
jgi:hypothetical protein